MQLKRNRKIEKPLPDIQLHECVCLRHRRQVDNSIFSMIFVFFFEYTENALPFTHKILQSIRVWRALCCLYDLRLLKINPIVYDKCDCCCLRMMLCFDTNNFYI